MVDVLGENQLSNHQDLSADEYIVFPPPSSIKITNEQFLVLVRVELICSVSIKSTAARKILKLSCSFGLNLAPL
ncbi:MAG: hypothetical protein CM15mP4_1910 [Candidatus Neomarinimicrobiota bacterium]|nr:MAG: hypothetical protein CM15mP4_1910 [Candidatus Neomarinimicrobiota bacterium]